MEKIFYQGGTHVKNEPGSALSVEPTVGHLVLSNGARVQVKRAWGNFTASGTAAAFVPAVANAVIRVVALSMIAGATATDVTFNSATTACGPLWALAVNGGIVLGPNIWGWCQTIAINEGLTVTTGAGSTVGIEINYIEITDDLYDLL